MFKETEDSFAVYFMATVMVILLLVMAIIAYAFLHQKKLVLLRIRLNEKSCAGSKPYLMHCRKGRKKKEHVCPRNYTMVSGPSYPD